MTTRAGSATPDLDVEQERIELRRTAAAILGPAGRPDTARVLMLAGGYGSGKTEVAVNLALLLARAGRRVQIADLDLVNPYFRCREARTLMERAGIRVVAPQGAHAFADLPIVLPEIAGMLDPPEDTITLFDVGGDDVGARVLASLKTALRRYELWLVVNSRRPFNASLDACGAMRAEIEQSARLAATGLVSNAHLVDETTASVVAEGAALALDVARDMDLPLRFVAVMDDLADAPELTACAAPLLRMQRHMLPPWRQTGDQHG